MVKMLVDNLKIIEDLIGKLSLLSAEELRELLELANQYTNTDPKSSLTKSREALERMVYDIYQKEMGEEPKKIEIGLMFSNTQFTKKIDTRIFKLMNYVRDMGNMGPHSLVGKVEEKDAIRVLDALSDIISWYIDQYKLIDEKQDIVIGSTKTEEHTDYSQADIEFQLAESYKKKKDDLEALLHYQNAAELGNIEAQFQVGMFFLEGRGVKTSIENAMEWFECAAKHGHMEAQFELGSCYHTGKYETQDFHKALNWISLAAEQGHAPAQRLLGTMYYKGEGTKANILKSISWLQKSAEQNDLEANLQLGILYEEGKEIHQDYAKAFNYYLNASTGGNKEGQKRLDKLYKNKWGVSKNNKAKLKWFSKVSVQNDDPVDLQLKNSKKVEAFNENLKSAENGNPLSQLRIGDLYLMMRE